MDNLILGFSRFAIKGFLQLQCSERDFRMMIQYSIFSKPIQCRHENLAAKVKSNYFGIFSFTSVIQQPRFFRKTKRRGVDVLIDAEALEKPIN